MWRGISMVIVEHIWTCNQCHNETRPMWRWFLRVDDLNFEDRMKLQRYENAISSHVAKFQHEVTHKVKDEFKVKFA